MDPHSVSTPSRSRPLSPARGSAPARRPRAPAPHHGLGCGGGGVQRALDGDHQGTGARVPGWAVGEDPGRVRDRRTPRPDRWRGRAGAGAVCEGLRRRAGGDEHSRAYPPAAALAPRDRRPHLPSQLPIPVLLCAPRIPARPPLAEGREIRHIAITLDGVSRRGPPSGPAVKLGRGPAPGSHWCACAGGDGLERRIPRDPRHPHTATGARGADPGAQRNRPRRGDPRHAPNRRTIPPSGSTRWR